MYVLHKSKTYMYLREHSNPQACCAILLEVAFEAKHEIAIVDVHVQGVNHDRERRRFDLVRI